MKAAVVQFCASSDKSENLQRILSLVSQAASKDTALVGFPEFMMLYTSSSQTSLELAEQAETIDGSFVSSVSQSAKENNIQIVGSFYEKSNIPNKVYDTSFIIDQAGNVISTYRKIHLYDALGFKESAKMTPGSQITKPVKTLVGMLGMLICYDLRFPEISRSLASAGSEVLIVPSAWVGGPMKVEHWIALNQARAIENGCYVLAPDHVGHTYCGHSMAIDPYGKILFDMRQREGIEYADIDATILKETRKSLPLLEHRRTDVYPDLCI